jgi:hypothetical protein
MRAYVVEKGGRFHAVIYEGRRSDYRTRAAQLARGWDAPRDGVLAKRLVCQPA